MEITREQFESALEQRDAAEKILSQYHLERSNRFEERLKSLAPFTDEELVYSATTLCPCGHGIAYPKECGPSHYWDCSAILKGIADKTVQHTGQLPFLYYDIKSEGQPSASGATTRGVFKPKPAEIQPETK